MKIYNAHVYTMEGANFDNGFVAFENGKITAAGDCRDMPPVCDGDFDARGGYAVPGFIDGHCHSGGYIWDLSETSEPVTPEVNIIDCINTEDPDFVGVVRSGVTAGVVSPGSCNLIGGTALVTKFGKFNTVEDAIVKDPCAMKAAMGENPLGTHGRENHRSPYSRMCNAAMLRDTLTRANRYLRAKERGDIDVPDQRMEAMLPIIKRELPFHFHAHRSDDIMSAIRVCREFGVRCVIVHATGGHLVADCIKEAGVPVIVGPVLFPNCKPEMAEGDACNTVELYKAGVDMCFGTDAWVIRGDDLAMSAAVSVSRGLPAMRALEMLTSDAARILGIDDRIGSLRKGKDADIAVFDEFPLSYTARTQAVFINGKQVY